MITSKPSAYHFPSGPQQNSPCMSAFWRAQPIRKGIVREEIAEHEEIDDEVEEGE